MRATFQVLVIPYILTNSEPEYAIFQTKQGYWQFIAGGGEDNETHLQAAKRESFEEAAIINDKYIALKSGPIEVATSVSPIAQALIEHRI